MTPLTQLRREAQAFRAAIDAAPDPAPGPAWFGARRWVHKALYVLLHEHASPGRLGLAVFVGCIVGATPLFGGHLALCLLLAFLFRLNKLAMWLGANISLPFFAPALAYASTQIAHRLLHGAWSPVTLDWIREQGFGGIFGYWLLGSPIVGALVGAVLGSLVWLAARQRGVDRRASSP